MEKISIYLGESTKVLADIERVLRQYNTGKITYMEFLYSMHMYTLNEIKEIENFEFKDTLQETFNQL